MKNDFPQYLTIFLSQYLPGQKNLSTNTIASYRDTFKLFLIFCEKEKRIYPEKLSIQKITKKLVLEFLNWLEKERKNSISTRNQRLAVLHSFFHYVQKEYPENLYEIQKILSIPSKKKIRPMISYLTGNEMEILLKQPDLSNEKGQRDLLLMVILYDTAARVQELIEIKLKDIRLSDPAVITLHGKGDKVRQVPIMGRTKHFLKKYIDTKKLNPGIEESENLLFVNQKQQKLSRWGISYIINKYVAIARENSDFKIGFPITPHVFRHSKAMHLLQSGVHLIYIRDFLGHSDCSTTEIYARADSEMKRKAIENAYQDLVPDEFPKWEKDSNLMQWLNSICN
ncbi:MAG: site-specific integrase [Bacillota bacterium]